MDARLLRRVLAESEKRSMHSTTGSAVVCARDRGVVRNISVVTADTTVSSLELDRQLMMGSTPLASRMYSLFVLSKHRLQRPPGTAREKHLR